ncbi:Type IV fimbrial biogenesis protein PilW [Moritella sp. JT01]|uniref:PilW family protein n=1 Tax=Moritella sp. JT01 TaxID=756698 RepID=UPI00079886C0|nr:PilW family protein [Moritella sp. JT01]KXO13532.1 Type IV fimbrial biogenesis protein PilW [Moritella sp. JT01]
MTVKQAGFNLVELMIALVIGLVLMVSITTMFVDTKVSANRSSTVSNLQQQAQLALQILVEDVRAIGSFAEFSGGGLTDIQVPNNIAAGDCSVVPVGGPAADDNLHFPDKANWIVRTPIDGITNVTVANCFENDDGYALAANSDVLSIARIRGVITPNPQANRYYVAISPMQAQLFTGVTPNIANAEIYPYLHHTYFVQDHDTNSPRLSRFSFIDGDFINDLVVSNIEQIRIDFGVDTTDDGRANDYYESNNVTTDMWSKSQIVSARIYVLARAKNKDLTLNNNETFNEKFKPFDPPNNDNYRRFLLSTTVIVKNNMMAVTQ